MSIYAIMYVWDKSKQKSTALLMMLALADYADPDTGECWPGIKALAQKARMKERNVQTLLNKLVTANEITIEHNQGAKTGTGKTNRYVINGYKEWRKAVQDIASLENKGMQLSVSQGVQEVAPKPSLKETSIKKTTTSGASAPVAHDKKVKHMKSIDEARALLNSICECEHKDHYLAGNAVLCRECGLRVEFDAMVAHEGQSDGVKSETVTDAGTSNGATLALDTIKAGHVVTLKNGKAVLVREVLPEGKFRVGKDLALDIITGDDLAPVQNGAAKVDRLEQIPDKPAPVKKARKPDALFDAIALHIFDIPKGSDVDGGRVGKIKKWCVAHDVTAQDVQAFREWWDEAKGKDVSVPRGEHTFPENYLAYQAAKPGKSKLVVY